MNTWSDKCSRSKPVPASERPGEQTLHATTNIPFSCPLKRAELIVAQMRSLDYELDVTGRGNDAPWRWIMQATNSHNESVSSIGDIWAQQSYISIEKIMISVHEPHESSCMYVCT